MRDSHSLGLAGHRATPPQFFEDGQHDLKHEVQRSQQLSQEFSEPTGLPLQYLHKAAACLTSHSSPQPIPGDEEQNDEVTPTQLSLSLTHKHTHMPKKKLRNVSKAISSPVSLGIPHRTSEQGAPQP